MEDGEKHLLASEGLHLFRLFHWTNKSSSRVEYSNLFFDFGVWLVVWFCFGWGFLRERERERRTK